MVVAMDRPLEGLDVDTVTVDNEAGAREAVRRLLAAGHRRVAALAGDVRIWTLARRFDGYLTALAEAGVPVDEALISTAHERRPTRRQTLQAMLDAAGPADGRLRRAPPWWAAARCAPCTTRALRSTSPSSTGWTTTTSWSRPRWSSPPPVPIESGSSRPSCWSSGWRACRRPPRHAVLAPLMLGPGERYVANVGALERVGPVMWQSEGTLAQASMAKDLPPPADAGSVPGTGNRSVNTRTEQIVR